MAYIENYKIKTNFDEFDQLLLLKDSSVSDVKCNLINKEDSTDITTANLGSDVVPNKTDVIFLVDTTENMTQSNIDEATGWIKSYIKHNNATKSNNIDIMFKFNSIITPVMISPNDLDDPAQPINKVRVTPETMPDFVKLVKFITQSLKKTSYLKTTFVLFTASCHRKVHKIMDRQEHFYKELMKESYSLHHVGLTRQFKICVIHLGKEDAEPTLYYRLVDLSTEKSLMLHYDDKIALTNGKMDRLTTKFGSPKYVIAHKGDKKIYEFTEFLGHTFFITHNFKGEFDLHNVLTEATSVSLTNNKIDAPLYLNKLANLYLAMKNARFLIINSFNIKDLDKYVMAGVTVLQDEYIDYYENLEHKENQELSDIDKAIYKKAKTCVDFLRYFINVTKKNPLFKSCEYLDIVCRAYEVLR